jgi:hypothetical protein
MRPRQSRKVVPSKTNTAAAAASWRSVGAECRNILTNRKYPVRRGFVSGICDNEAALAAPDDAEWVFCDGNSFGAAEPCKHACSSANRRAAAMSLQGLAETFVVLKQALTGGKQRGRRRKSPPALSKLGWIT